VSWPKRYSPFYTLRNGDTGLASFGVEPRDDGIYVEYSDYWKLFEEVTRLKAEVERLTSVSEAWKKRRLDKVEAECINWADVENENARLKAEVERLTEAWVDKKMQEDRDALLQQVERLTKAIDLTLIDLDERHERQDLRAWEFAELLRKAKGDNQE
jgi:hypothetical protein